MKATLSIYCRYHIFFTAMHHIKSKVNIHDILFTQQQYVPKISASDLVSCFPFIVRPSVSCIRKYLPL